VDAHVVGPIAVVEVQQVYVHDGETSASVLRVPGGVVETVELRAGDQRWSLEQGRFGFVAREGDVHAWISGLPPGQVTVSARIVRPIRRVLEGYAFEFADPVGLVGAEVAEATFMSRLDVRSDGPVVVFDTDADAEVRQGEDGFTLTTGGSSMAVRWRAAGDVGRDVFFVVDQASWRSEDEMAAVRDDLTRAVRELDPRDRFAIVSHPNPMLSTSRWAVPATADARAHGLRVVASLEANGVLGFGAQLVATLSLTRDDARRRVVYVLTNQERLCDVGAVRGLAEVVTVASDSTGARVAPPPMESWPGFDAWQQRAAGGWRVEAFVAGAPALGPRDFIRPFPVATCGLRPSRPRLEAVERYPRVPRSDTSYMAPESPLTPTRSPSGRQDPPARPGMPR
jgi:hypothetical protein